MDQVAVPGRQRSQRSGELANLKEIRLVRGSARVPMFVNGDVLSLKDARRIAAFTGVNGKLRDLASSLSDDAHGCLRFKA